jgi:amidophosphoribosyltransferase
MDSEVIAHLLAHSPQKDPKEALAESLAKLAGAYSLVLMLNDILVGARDPYGWRPLCIGKLDGAHILASETCALDLIGAEYVRDVAPGETVFIHKDRIESFKAGKCAAACAFCIFEYIYFSRPDSSIFGHNVYLARRNLGRQLAKEFPVRADLVMPIPDSGTSAALGFSQASGIPFETGLIRNHYIGRTFIQPSQLVRDFRVKIKLNPVKEVLKGKDVVVIEDSIVRGTTSRARVKTLREAGARSIHMRVSCPPIVSPCFYGIDFPTSKELIAAKYSVEWIRDFIGVDSLEYLSLQGMLAAMPLPAENFCTACFSKNYPLKPSGRISKEILEK